MPAHVRVCELAAQYGHTQSPEALDRIRSFLRNWWSGHIMDVDTTIAQYAVGKEDRIQAALAELQSGASIPQR